MPRYSMTGKNGKLYTVDGPPGLTREVVQAEILRRAPEAGQAKGAVEDVLEEIPLVGGALTGLADIGLGAVQGAAGVTKAATEAFGADTGVSKFFGDVAQEARNLMSAQERGDLAEGERIMREAEGKGIWEEVKAAVSAFSKSPLTLAAQGVGSALPFAAASVATGGGAAAPLALGALTGAGAVKGSIYDAVESAAIEQGLTPEQAAAMADEAQSYGGKNLDQIALGTVLGGVAGRFGLEPALAKVIGGQVAKRAIVRGAVAEAVPEAVQAGQERVAQNIALQREGAEVPTFKGVAGQATMEGILGGVPGAAVGAIGPREAAPAEKRVPPELQGVYDALPADADEGTKSSFVDALVQRGIPDDVAQTIVERMSLQKAAEAERDRKIAEQQAAVREAQTAGIEPVAEPDIEAEGMQPFAPTTRARPTDTEERAAMERAYAEEVGRIPVEEEVAPVAPAVARPTISAFRATQILNDPVALSDYEAAGGDIDDLYDAAEDIKYSRGRRPKDVETMSLFGTLPTQEAGRLDKREELMQRALALSPEERAAQIDESMAAAQQRTAEVQQREVAQREETLGDIEYALQAQAPENQAYRVLYEPEDANAPYKLVAERTDRAPEVVLRAPTLQDFSDRVYGQMGELTPYIPEAPAAIQALEAADEVEPTLATSLVQEIVAEIDAARNAGQLDNNQRTELLRRLERPEAYTPAGKPKDTIAKREADARKAMEKFRNSTGVEAKAAEAELAVANEALQNAVQYGLLNPIRATMRSMVENRQLEREGAGVRIKEATPQLERAQLQQRLGEMEGAEVGPERRAAAEAKREIREAKIDITQQRVTKFRRGPDKDATTRVSEDEAKAIADKITSQWKSTVPVEVVQAVEDIKDGKIRRALKRDKATDAEGFVTPDGTVYLIADNIASPERVRAVLFHEALGHLGLEKLFREELDGALTALYRSNPALRGGADAWLKDNPDAYVGDSNRTARAVEEVLAERSENGQLKLNRIQRIAAIIRNFARKMGIKLAISDADVEAILAAAHERAITDDQVSTLVKGMRYIGRARPAIDKAIKYSKPNTDPKTAKELEDMDASMSVGLRRATKTQNTYAIADGIGAAIKARKMKPFIKALKENFDGFKPASFRATLYSLPTSGIIDWFGGEIPSLKDIDELVLRMSNMKANIIKAAEPTAERLDEFLLRDQDRQLARVQGVSRINEISPDEHASMDAALKDDKVIKEVEGRILKNSNDKKAAAQLVADIKELVLQYKDARKLKGDLSVMSEALKAKLRELEKLSIDRSQSENHVTQLAEMTRRIRDTYKEWEKLGQVEGGQQLYKDMRAFYKDMFEAELALLDARIETITDKEEAKRLRDLRAEMMRDKLSPEEAKKAGDTFWDIDADLFTKDYFPFMREGKYWLRVKPDKKAARETEFYTFYSAKDRDRALEKVAARLGVDPENSEVLSTGDEIADLQADLKSEDLMMQRVFDLVGKAKVEVAAKGSTNLKELLDEIYQTWLLSTPERSVRRRLMHSEEVVGYSQDILNHFSRQITAYANQLSKMAFAGQIRMQADAAKDSIKDRPTSDRRKLEAVIREIEARTEQEINPDPQSAFVNVLNRASYFYYLTAPATAVIQTTSIPIRVVPRLWKDYGYAKGTAMWVKYMKVWQTLGTARAEKVPTGIGDQLHAAMPSITGSKLINADTERGALLRRALKAGMDRNVLETVTDTLIQNERETAKVHREGVGRLGAKVAEESAKVMGVLFQGMENISRQASYFMTFELAYDDYKAKNPNAPEQDVFDHAVRKGLEVVRDTLGEYTNWERPRLAKNNWTRALFLFKMHAIVQTKFLVQNFRALTKGLFSDWGADARAARAGAAKELTGVMMMAGVFGGLMALPFYSIMATALAEGFDDEDDEDVRRLMGLDPRVAYDSDIMFRRWVEEKFGNPEANGIDLADILINGPIAVLTNTELASRTSLDLKNMWFREGMGGDSTANSIINAITANIAGAQMAVNMAKSYDDFKEGNIESGLKKLAPAFFRSWVTTIEQEQKGVQDAKGNTIIPKSDIDELDKARSIIGFRPMDLARWQDYYITRAKNEKRIDGEKASILRKLDRMVREGDIKTQDDFVRFWNAEVEPFNRTYPDPAFVISLETIQRSLEGREEVRGRTYRGMQVEKKTAERDVRMARPFEPQ